jgi:hypothetical protein
VDPELRFAGVAEPPTPRLESEVVLVSDASSDLGRCFVDRFLAESATYSARAYEIVVDAYRGEIRTKLSASIPSMYPELVSA